jgi:hypothetical protein
LVALAVPLQPLDEIAPSLRWRLDGLLGSILASFMPYARSAIEVQHAKRQRPLSNVPCF